MTEPTRQEQIDRLAIEFMGWHRRPGTTWWVNELDIVCARSTWNPFESRDDAYDLLKRCEQLGLEEEYGEAKVDIVVAAELKQRTGRSGDWLNEMATAEQKTKAVWTVAGLEAKSR